MHQRSILGASVDDEGAVDLEDAEIGDRDAGTGDEVGAKLCKFGFDLVVELGEGCDGCLALRFLSSLGKEEFVVAWVPEVTDGLKSPVDVEGLDEVILRVIAMLSSKVPHDGVGLVNRATTFLPERDLAGGEFSIGFHRGHLFKGDSLVLKVDTLVRQHHADGHGLAVEGEVDEGGFCRVCHLNLFCFLSWK